MPTFPTHMAGITQGEQSIEPSGDETVLNHFKRDPQAELL